MPFDAFQKRILQVLSKARTPDSVFAGGSVLQRHGFRLSDDQDIFHAGFADVVAIAELDSVNLRSAGFDVDVVLRHEGLVEATVFSESEGASRVQWVEAGSYHFFAPVPDEELGWRLHMADIATGKALAAGGRRQARDYVDLSMIHEHLLPLWHVLWAAPGKDSQWSPLSLAEKIARTNEFAQPEIDVEVSSLIALSARSIGVTIREAIEEARAVFERLPEETAGCLFVDELGEPAVDVGAILEPDSRYRAISAQRGGAWPSGPDIDRALILRMIGRYGPEGSYLVQGDVGLPQP